jgi:post-segregation antitoxin (ccd killing protein)
VKLELSESLEEQLRERAKHLGVNVEDLARAAVADLVGQPATDFEKAAQEVLARNADLYRRLA